MKSHGPTRRTARGLSIVELLIGIAVGLFVLAGAAMVATNQITDNRRLLLETQIQQDMRTAMDIIVRDIRRSGYSFKAETLPAVGASALPPNAYSPAGALVAGKPLLYTYSVGTFVQDDNGMADAQDFRGFKDEDGIIKVQLGKDNWQPLTDGEVVSIKVSAEENKTETLLPTAACGTPPCKSSADCGDARVVSRIIQLTMVGEARHDKSIVRTLKSAVRVRNDEVCL
jgi:type II secretory pathway pseudopilin PulG